MITLIEMIICDVNDSIASICCSSMMHWHVWKTMYETSFKMRENLGLLTFRSYERSPCEGSFWNHMSTPSTLSCGTPLPLRGLSSSPADYLCTIIHSPTFVRPSKATDETRASYPPFGDTSRIASRRSLLPSSHCMSRWVTVITFNMACCGGILVCITPKPGSYLDTGSSLDTDPPSPKCITVADDMAFCKALHRFYETVAA